jgi:hypothetical protein
VPPSWLLPYPSESGPPFVPVLSLPHSSTGDSDWACDKRDKIHESTPDKQRLLLGTRLEIHKRGNRWIRNKAPREKDTTFGDDEPNDIATSKLTINPPAVLP